MADRRLTILAYVHKTPSFAMCERCHLKFFTPKELTKKPIDAEANLRQKFEMRDCKHEAQRGQAEGLLQGSDAEAVAPSPDHRSGGADLEFPAICRFVCSLTTEKTQANDGNEVTMYLSQNLAKDSWPVVIRLHE